MNFLAHAYLSGGNRDIIIGNFIADAVRGKEYGEFRQGIIQGILIHRQIDSYTDQHPVVIQTKVRLRNHFGKYSSVVSDIYYDHFLALHWKDYSEEPLDQFTENIYSIIRNEIDRLPEEVKYFFPYMVKGNWLYNYQYFQGLQRVFEGMSKRAKFDSKMEKAVDVLKADYLLYENEFRSFFPQLKAFVATLL